MKTVSLIVPTYNGEKYIERFLISLFEQKKKPNEVIFRDDHSTDNTVNIIKNFIFKNNINNWIIYTNNVNVGWRKNFQLLLSTAKCDIIFFADQDDIWYSHKIADMAGYFESNSKIKVLSSDYDIDSSQGNVVNFGSLEVEHYINSEVSKVKFSKENFTIKRPGWTFAIDKRILPYYQEAQYQSTGKSYDAIIWQVGLIDGSLYHLSKVTGKWVMHDDSAISKESKKIKTEKKKILTKYFWDEYNFSKFCLNSISNNQINAEQRAIRFLAKRKQEYLQRHAVVSSGSFLTFLSGVYNYTRIKDLLADFRFVRKL